VAAKAPQLKAQAAASRPKDQARADGGRRAVERKGNQSNSGQATFSIDAITQYPGENSDMIITEKAASVTAGTDFVRSLSLVAHQNLAFTPTL
jgi:hypothetical protein